MGLILDPYRFAAFPSLFSILTDNSLTTNLEFCLDAGSATSYDGSAQSWLDETANSFDFFLGATVGAEASDPTFNGTSGLLTSAEYFSYDGGDYNRYDTTLETWMNNLHKDNAIFSLMMMIYLPSGATVSRPWGTDGNALGAGVEFQLQNGNLPRLVAYNASAAIIDKAATTTLNADAWNMTGLSINEATGAGGGFHYLNGAYNQVSASDTFDSTYSSPVTDPANFTMEIGACGNAQSPVKANTRIATVAVWEGTALSKANFDTIWNAHKTRFGL